MSAATLPTAGAEPAAEELLRVTLAALNARPMFRLGHVGDRGTIRDSYQLASAIERWLARRTRDECSKPIDH